ncbi:MAG: methyltransferase [Ruminococcaceae bacterium]|nr:methyltransferase [Oscillospiraceae bacterium]
MNMNSWLQELKTAPVKKSMPILSFPCVSLMNVTVKELVQDSDLQASGMQAIAQRVDSLAAVSMMDLSVEAEAFGMEITMTDSEVPVVNDAIVTSMEDAEKLQIPTVGTKRTGIYIEAIRKACTLISDRPVFAGVIGPFSLAGRLMDVTEALVNCYIEPDMVKLTMEKTTAFLIAYINAYKEAGANGVVIAEPLTGLLSPDLAQEFSEPYVRQIVDAVQTDDFIVIYHNCGNNVIEMIDSILNTGAAAYHFGNAISMEDMMTHIPPDTVAMGNIDPSAQFLNGTPESIREETLALMNRLCPRYPNFVISSGCDIPPMSKWENIHAYFNAIQEYYQK